MKNMKFIWQVEVYVDEDEVREFLDLDEDDETELDYSDFKDCAWAKIEDEDCEYSFHDSKVISE